MYFFLFTILSSLSVFFGLTLIFFQNPMYSILSLVCCIFFSVIILFLYGIEFMSFVYLVVYIGAIAILFLFMIMMLNINSINSFHFIPSLIPFFLYLSIFFKGIYLIFLVNKNIFIFYIDYLQTTIFALNYSNAAYSELFNSSYVFYLQNIRIYDTYGASFYFTKVTTDSLADILISGLEPASSELANFCILYDIYSLYFILAGFILLYAMLGSISLCIAK